MKVTALTYDLIEQTAKTAGYTLQEVCAIIPKGHKIEYEFYCQCMGSSYRDANWKDEAAERLAPIMKEIIENMSERDKAYNRFKHKEDMLSYGWTTQEEVDKAKKIFEAYGGVRQ